MDRYFALFHVGLLAIYTGIGLYGFYWVHEWLRQQVHQWNDALSQSRTDVQAQLNTLRSDILGHKHNTLAEARQYTDAALLELAKKIKGEMEKVESTGVVRKRPMTRRKAASDD